NGGSNPALQLPANIVGALGSGIVKTGPGWLRLMGSNNFIGDIVVQDGRLTASSATALNQPQHAVTITQHGQLHVDAPLNITNFNVTVQTDNTVPAVLCGSSGVVTFTGTFTLAGGVNQFATAPGCTLRLGFIEGAGDLVVNDAGNGVVFSGQNGNTGKTLVAVGTLRSQPPGRPSEDSAITMANATLDLHDAKAEQRLPSLAGSGQVLLGDASTIVTTPLDTTFSGSISGDATLVKMGAGNWTLTGQLPFSGVINIRNGSLTVDGSLAGGVVLNTFEKGAASSVLYGVGTIGAIDTEDGGRLQPGHATEPGRLTSQWIDLKPSVTFGAIVNDVKPGTGYSQLVVKGTVTLVGAVLDLKVNPSFVSALAAGAVPDLVLIDNDGTDPIDGTFLDLPEGAIVTSNTGVQFRISYVGGTGNDVTLTPRGNEYFLSEGSTGSFFDTDVLIANPFPTATPITIKFLKDDGTTVSIDRTLGGSTRMTVHVNEVAGMESTAFSTIVTSHDGLPIVVERTMTWDKTAYGGHTEKATAGAANTWYFAEGSQGFYSTFLLLMNPQATANTVTVQYLVEGGPAVARTYTMAATSRLTVDLGSEPALQSRSFGMIVTFDAPGVAERAMYFGTNPIWKGGHESAGVTAPATTWYVAEGATGSYFTTFILLANPTAADADATLTFLPASGPPVVRTKTVPAFGRVTVNIADEDPSLASAAVSTTVTTSGAPILVERSQYWPFTPDQWQEAHNSEGVTELGTSWGLAEGRVGGPQSYQTYILLGNPQPKPTGLSIIFLREDGTTVTKMFVVPAISRLNVAVGPGTDVPELVNERFGAVITSELPIVVERSMYWDANGIVWAAGTSATATKLPQ